MGNQLFKLQLSQQHKTWELIAGLALAGLAQGASIAQLRGFSKSKLINLHKKHVHAANASQTEISFIDAFAAKAQRDGVPNTSTNPLSTPWPTVETGPTT